MCNNDYSRRTLNEVIIYQPWRWAFMTQTLAQIMERTQWFRQARFGMFLHWGL